MNYESFFTGINDDRSFLEESVEIMIDRLHSLVSDGNYADAVAVADRIKELQQLTA